MKARYIWLPLVIVSAFLAGTLVPIGKTQQKPPKYIEVTYMRVDPSRESDYVKFGTRTVEASSSGAHQRGQTQFVASLRSQISFWNGGEVQLRYDEHL